MGTRPRTAFVQKLKARRCPKCGSKINTQRKRCKQCASPVGKPKKGSKSSQ